MPTTRSMGLLRRTAQRIPIRRRHPQGQISQQSRESAEPSLYQYQFSPLLSNRAQCLTNWKEKERGVFTSLSYLGALYGFPPPKKTIAPYPANIEIGFQYAQSMMKHLAPETSLCIVAGKECKAAVATFIEMETRYDLYYLPLEPAARLGRQSTRKNESSLLWCILSYLFCVVNIDSYVEEDAYLFYYFAMIRDAAIYEDPEDNLDSIDTAANALKIGEQMRRQMSNKNHLRDFQRRLEKFNPTDEIGKELADLAQKTWELYQAYPTRSFVDSIPTGFLYPRIEGDEPYPLLIREQRFSFTWELEGSLADEMERYFNDDQQYNVGLDNPISLQIFDRPQTTITMNFDFETRAIDLITSLCDFLIHIV